VGELKVNGYSAYLHPVGENMILGGLGERLPNSRKGGRIRGGIKAWELFRILAEFWENLSSLGIGIHFGIKDTYPEI